MQVIRSEPSESEVESARAREAADLMTKAMHDKYGVGVKSKMAFYVIAVDLSGPNAISCSSSQGPKELMEQIVKVSAEDYPGADATVMSEEPGQ